jgi:hypothetical protein
VTEENEQNSDSPQGDSVVQNKKEALVRCHVVFLRSVFYRCFVLFGRPGSSQRGD